MLPNLLTNFQSALDGNTQLRAQINRARTVTLLGGNMVTNDRSESSGVCARVYQNGVYGFASNAEYSNASIEAVWKAARENAAFLNSRIQNQPKALPSFASGQYQMQLPVQDFTQKHYIDFAQQVDAYIDKTYPDLASRIVIIKADSMEKHTCVSDGFNLYSLIPRSHLYVFMTADTKEGSTVELYTIMGGNGYFDAHFTNPELLYAEIDHLYTELMKKAEGIYPDAGVKDVVMHPKLAGILAHEAVGHTVEADLVMSGSVAGPNLGKQVASDLVTMVDFAHTIEDGSAAPIPIYVDEEGTPAEDAILIENGILKGYMHSRESAAHFDVMPQGNARAYSFSDEPLIRMRNTAILPGTDRLEDMIASIDDGYYFTDTNNGQADMTGEFMFGVSMGYEIKNGKLGRALRDTTISGIAFEMLKTVDMLSSDMYWTCSGMCGKKQWIPVGMGGPAVKCKINVGGR